MKKTNEPVNNSGISQDLAEKILKVRGAFIDNDTAKLWWWLFRIADPSAEKENPWEELERIAKRKPNQE